MPERNRATRYAAAKSGQLVKSLGPLDATMIVAGSMIGSGIFIVSADIARQVGSPALLIVAWLVTGLMTMMAALCYAELAAAMPKAGGEYVFLRESFGSMWGFLYGWTMLLVIQTATIAAVAIAFANFTGVLFPRVSASAWIWKPGTLGPYKMWFGILGPYSPGLNTQNLLAILSLIFLTWINTRGLRLGAKVQNIFTFGENRSAWRPDPSWLRFRDAGCAGGQLRTFLARRRSLRHACVCRRPANSLGSYADAGRIGDGRSFVFLQRLDQRHLHGGGGKKSQAQLAALAGAGSGYGDAALRAG